MILGSRIRSLASYKLVILIAAAAISFGNLSWAQQASPSVPESHQPTVAFEVASIKPHPANGPVGEGWGYSSDNFSANNLAVAQLIFFAYDLKSDSQLQGLPKWGSSDHWDIQAKLNEDAAQALRKLDREQSTKERQRLVQDLLQERFRLQIHREIRTLPIYELAIAKNGFMPKALPSDGPSQRSAWSSGDDRFDGSGIGISALVTTLSSSSDVGRVVVDKTGLTGRYDMKLRWTPSNQPESAGSAPSIFTALQEQLGLKLVASKAPVEVIVVDHIEQPSEN